MMDEVDEDLWIGHSRASSHLIGSEKGVFDKKMIKGSVNTANGEKMKIKCEGKVNVGHFTKTGYESKELYQLIKWWKDQRSSCSTSPQHWQMDG